MCGDAREILARMPKASVECVVTSPPYYAVRDYHVDGQLGQEPSIEQWVATCKALPARSPACSPLGRVLAERRRRICEARP